MSAPCLIIVTGHPATGKTRLSLKLADLLGLPCLNKDGIKERMADELGVGDREESKRVGRASYAVLDYVVETYLRAGLSLIAESNFPAEFYSEKFGRLCRQYGFLPIQVLCRADPEELMRRVVRRIETGERHFSHMESGDIESGLYRRRLGDGRILPLDIGGELIEVETTDFSKVDYEGLAGQVAVLLARA